MSAVSPKMNFLTSSIDITSLDNIKKLRAARRNGSKTIKKFHLYIHNKKTKLSQEDIQLFSTFPKDITPIITLFKQNLKNLNSQIAKYNQGAKKQIKLLSHVDFTTWSTEGSILNFWTSCRDVIPIIFNNLSMRDIARCQGLTKRLVISMPPPQRTNAIFTGTTTSLIFDPVFDVPPLSPLKTILDIASSLHCKTKSKEKIIYNEDGFTKFVTQVDNLIKKTIDTNERQEIINRIKEILRVISNQPFAFIVKLFILRIEGKCAACPEVKTLLDAHYFSDKDEQFYGAHESLFPDKAKQLEILFNADTPLDKVCQISFILKKVFLDRQVSEYLSDTGF